MSIRYIAKNLQTEISRLMHLEDSIKQTLQEFVPIVRTSQHLFESSQERLQNLQQELAISNIWSSSRDEQQFRRQRSPSHIEPRSQSCANFDEEPMTQCHNVRIEMTGNSYTNNIKTIFNRQMRAGCGSYTTLFGSTPPRLPFASFIPTYSGYNQPTVTNVSPSLTTVAGSRPEFMARTRIPVPFFARRYNLQGSNEADTFGTFHNMQRSNSSYGAGADGIFDVEALRIIARPNARTLPAYAFRSPSYSASNFQYYRGLYGPTSSTYNRLKAASANHIDNAHSSSEEFLRRAFLTTASRSFPIGGATRGSSLYTLYIENHLSHNNNFPNEYPATKPNKEFLKSPKVFNKTAADSTCDGFPSKFHYERQLEYIAGIHGWNRQEQLLALMTNLRGKALELYERVSTKTKPTFQQLPEIFGVHFGGITQAYYKRFRERVQEPQESLLNFALELNWLAISSFIGAPKPLVEELVKQQFIDGLYSKEMREQLRVLELKDVTEALLKARNLGYRIDVEMGAQECQTEEGSDRQSYNNGVGNGSNVPSFFKKLCNYWENWFNEPSFRKLKDDFKNLLEVTA